MFGIIFGIAEYVGFTYMLSYAFTQLKQHNTSFFPCLMLLLVMIWVGMKIQQITQSSDKGELVDGE
ncbi:TPA: hypothetical protein ACXNW8_001360 [Clostridium botulinum]|uniref:hypothetical protein n=1 Tax=Clostridium botulinum TaxID=1491 RepID=UPI001C9AD12E|nr:hypothetical protein [Clostridium botulinum]MBY6909562.1 hypothetical protein [Clostridium botulinum]